MRSTVLVLIVGLPLVSGGAAASQGRETRPAPQTSPQKPAASSKSSESVKPKQFTNDDVLKLKTAGFSDAEILAAIAAARETSFDTSADGLIALKTAGISARVIAAILGQPYPVEDATKAAASAPTSPTAADHSSTEAPNGERKPAAKGGGFLGALGIRKVDDDSKKTPKTSEGAGAVKSQKLKDGQPAVIKTQLSVQEAMQTVQDFLESRRNLRTEIAGDTVKTDWSGEMKCPGFTVARCKERADAQVRSTAEGTTIRLWVSESRRNKGTNNWGDKGPEADRTALVAAELEQALVALDGNSRKLSR